MAKNTETGLTAPEKRKLPQIKDLYNEDSIAKWEKENELHVLLNQPPNAKWMQPHPYARRKVRMDDGTVKDAPAIYLPIARQEWLMTYIFINWYVEILSYQLIANSVAVAVRVHYQNPVDGEWKWTDGVGAVALQTDAGAGAVDFQKIKSSAVQMALPAAKSYAFKDAVESLGNILGKDSNRLDPINYDSMLSTFDSTPSDEDRWSKAIKDGLEAYTGVDKELIRSRCQDAKQFGEFTKAFVTEIAVKLGINL